MNAKHKNFAELYKQEILPQLRKSLGLTNIMEVPRITKITLNMGLGEAAQDKKLLTNALEDMRVIAGQQPVVTRARKSIAGFKIRQNMELGLTVTLRGEKMYTFLTKLLFSSS